MSLVQGAYSLEINAVALVSINQHDTDHMPNPRDAEPYLKLNQPKNSGINEKTSANQ